MINQFVKKQDTLCWGCQNACGGCSWSSKKQIPVPGWVAKPTHRKISRYIRPELADSFLVLECPEFIADVR